MAAISQQSIKQALSRAMHPEIDYSLVDLGMIKDIASEGNKVGLVLKLPFLNVPVKDSLIEIIKKTLTDLDETVKVDISLEEMGQKEREEFMKKAREEWKL